MYFSSSHRNKWIGTVIFYTDTKFSSCAWKKVFQYLITCYRLFEYKLYIFYNNKYSKFLKMQINIHKKFPIIFQPINNKNYNFAISEIYIFLFFPFIIKVFYSNLCCNKQYKYKILFLSKKLLIFIISNLQ